MIAGIGVDITDIERVRQKNAQHPHFLDKVLTPTEREQFDHRHGQKRVEYLAGRFSAKESFSKALGTGIGKSVSFQDLEVLDDDLGRPTIRQDVFKGLVHVSISHTDQLVMTEVILEEG